MSIYTIIISIGLLIFLAHLFNELFNLTKIPNVLLLLLIGMIIGPFSGIVTKDFFGELGSVFTTITLIVILFESGSGFRVKDIVSSIGTASLLTLVNFILTMALVTLMARLLFSLDPLSSAFIGAILGGTSSAVVIPMVRQLKMGEKSTSVLILESALSDVLCLVVGLALLDGMNIGEVSVGMVFSKMWKAFLFAMLLGVAGGVVWSLLIRLVRSIKNSMMITLAAVFILYGLIEMMGHNGGIAVLTFGITLGNIESVNENGWFNRIFRVSTSGFNEREKDFFSEIVFIMQTFFFVYVGISLQFGSPWVYITGLFIVFLIILLRVPAIYFLIGKKVTPPERSVMSVMTPKGLVPAVLASIPLQRGLANGEIILDLGYSIVLFSIVICSVLVIILSMKPDFFENLINKYRKKQELTDS